MKKDDKIYLIHILESIQKIEKFLKKQRQIKDIDDIVEDAIIKNLQNMAESTQRLSDDLKVSVKDIPWRDISDFRNKLVHDYLGISREIIYKVIKSDLPKLKKRITKMVEFLEKKEV